MAPLPSSVIEPAGTFRQTEREKVTFENRVWHCGCCKVEQGSCYFRNVVNGVRSPPPTFLLPSPIPAVDYGAFDDAPSPPPTARL